MIPHIQIANNWVLVLVLLALISLLWKIGSTVIIFTLYMIHSRRQPRGVSRDKYLRVALIAISYILMMVLSVASLSWDLYHYGISCWCFPLGLRIAITIPAMILGDLGSWKMIQYQLNDPMSGIVE